MINSLKKFINKKSILISLAVIFPILISLAFFLTATPVDSVPENWEKIADNLYVDTNSIDKQFGDYITGYFKQTDVKKKVKGRQVAYTKIWTGAFCDNKMIDNIGKLQFPIYWYYDKNDKLIEENNIHKYWQKHHPGGHLGVMYLEDDDFGELYFNTLCK
jgi:hypothetical protein